MRILAPMFVLTYAAMVASTVLIRLERGWAVTAISLSGLGANALLNAFLIPACWRTFGRGGAGIGAAWALVATEAAVTALMLLLIGGRAFDRRSLSTMGKTALACLLALAAHRALAGLGPARIAADALVYFGFIVAFKAVRIGEVVSLVRLASRHKGAYAVAS